MIRIDLGKDGLEKKNTATNLKDFFDKLKTKGFKANGPKGTKIDVDYRTVVIIAVVTAVACLPHLFVAQYRSYIEGQHASVMQSLKDKQAALNQEIAKYQSYQRELESYERQKKLIQDRLAIVRQLLEARGTPVNVLDSIGQSLPQRAWLTALEYKTSPDLAGATPGVVLGGEAYSNEDISDFVDKLSESIHLSDVNLESVNPKVEKDVEVKTFEVKAVPKGTYAETGKGEDPARATTSTPPQAQPPQPGQAKGGE